MPVADSSNTEVKSAPTLPRQYKLFVTEDEMALFWQLRDEGVTISAEGVSWRIGGVERARAWNDIEDVYLTDRLGDLCTIGFQGGPPLFVRGVIEDGNPDPGRDSIYREFVQTLHAQLARPEHSAVRFYAGVSGATAAKALPFTAALMFVVITISLVFASELLEAALVFAVGTIFFWLFWRVAQANEPREYSPRDLPYDLLP